jgi:hypothetical protein
LIGAELSVNALFGGNYEQKRWGSSGIGRLKKTHQRPFVGLVFWPLQALTELTHKLSAFDPSESGPIGMMELTVSVKLAMLRGNFAEG